MIHPDHWSPDYKKNIQKLQDDGYHFPTAKEMPEHLKGFCGALSFLVNDAGQVKSVSQSTGEIKDVSRTPPHRKPPGPAFRL